MTLLVIGLILFLGCHSISVFAEPWRDRMVERLGLMTWQGIYSLLALAGLVLIVMGYGAAREAPVLLYITPGWTRHIAMLLLLPVFPLFLSAYLPGRIKDATKHPMLAATKLWALSHLMVNGLLADVLLFGAFLVWAGIDRMSYRHRTPRAVRTAPAGKLNDVVAVIAGLGLYALFVVWAHGAVTGIPLIPAK